MLKNIKSSYIVGKIFPYLNGIRKLYLAQYNKNLQNKFGISLKNYKLYSGNILYMKLIKKEEFVICLMMIYYMKVNF